ncbi:MAG: prepilin-type N-terminal cleavage/methylation domain-containing protein [candidate division WOR-3 bacterium]
MRKIGFTLIELMIVIVIIGILVAIAVPNFVRVLNRAKEAEVESNMHITQLEVEFYAIGHSSVYPPTVDSIINNFPDYMKNPFNHSAPAVQDGREEDIEGVVEYETSEPYEHYKIRGLGRNAAPLPLILSEGLVK